MRFLAFGLTELPLLSSHARGGATRFGGVANVIKYETFIHELERLREEASRVRNHKRRDQDPAFRKWRLELQSLVTQARHAAYVLPCEVKSSERLFGSSLYDETTALSAFQLEMNDTINELDVIIEAYKRDGTPPPMRRPPSQITEPSSDKITFAWLWHHVPFHVGATGAGIVIGAFALGFYAGRTEWIVRLWTALFG